MRVRSSDDVYCISARARNAARKSARRFRARLHSLPPALTATEPVPPSENLRKSALICGLPSLYCTPPAGFPVRRFRRFPQIPECLSHFTNRSPPSIRPSAPPIPAPCPSMPSVVPPPPGHERAPALLSYPRLPGGGPILPACCKIAPANVGYPEART